MRMIILAGIFALSASTSLAQTDTTPAQAAPEPETTTPTQPAPAPETAPADSAAATTEGPANLCQELLAFMKAPPPEDEAAAAKPAAAEKPAEPQAEQEASGQREAPAQEDTSALAGTTHTGDGATAKPGDEASSSQEVTGQDGVATDAPKPSDDKDTSAGSVANAPQRESRSAPVPPADVSSTPKETVMTVEEAEQLAAANDIAACQDMARQMRVAGVSMPPTMIALTALDLQYQQTGGASQQAPQTEEPAAQPEQ